LDIPDALSHYKSNSIVQTEMQACEYSFKVKYVIVYRLLGMLSQIKQARNVDKGMSKVELSEQKELIHEFFRIEQQRKEEEEKIGSHREQEEKSAQQGLSKTRAQADSRLQSGINSLKQTTYAALEQGKGWLQEVEEAQRLAGDKLRELRLTHLAKQSVQSPPPVGQGREIQHRCYSEVEMLFVRSLLNWTAKC